jgi:putative colanic acid biosynthesis acetyltransferase WcaF
MESKDNSILKHRLSLHLQLYRALWSVVWTLFARPFPRSYFNSWKVMLLRLFGATIKKNAIVYSSAKIYNPKKLVMEEGSVLGDNVDCYNVDIVHLGRNAIVSQKVYLCTASHNIYDGSFKLITAGIYIGDNAWVAADAFVAMGVSIGHDAVVGARSSVFKNVTPNTIVGGNPAKFIRNRF